MPSLFFLPFSLLLFLLPLLFFTDTNPAVVSKGQPTEIIVRALTPHGDPISQAHVKISAGGVAFIHSNSTTVDGSTDANGMFSIPWECVQCAPTYLSICSTLK
jgi:hypothetical protein